jgi:ABC-type glycerol-3-phosphate transport system substrate-binding protein
VALLNSVADGADWWNQLQNFPLAYGGAWAKGKTLQFTSAPVVNSMKYWVELLTKGGPKGSSEAAITKLWESDRIAMNLNVAAGLNSLKTLAPKLYPNLRSAPPPWPGKKAIARLHPVTVLKSSKNQDAAMELVKWMVTPKNLYAVTTTNGYPIIPYSNFGQYEPAYATYLKTTPWMSGYLATNYVGEVDILGDYTVVYSQIGEIIIKAMANAVSGGQSVESALAAAQKQAQQELGPQVGA